MMKKPFVVVGGGLAGLTAAIALADQGHDVLLYERSSRFGGRARTQWQQGFALNFAPHALYVDGSADATFRQWGIKFSGKRPSLKDLAYFILTGEKRPFIETLADAAIPKLLMSTDISHTAGSFEEWVARNVQSEHGSQLLRSLLRLATYCAHPELMNARAVIRQLQLAFSKGVLYLDEGWETLVRGLVAKGDSLGIYFESDTTVAYVEPGFVRLANGRKISAAGIILAASWETVNHLTSHPPLPRPVKARMALLDVGLRQMPDKAAYFGLGVDSPLYLSVHSVWASLAPPGAAVVHIGKYLSSDDSGTRKELEQFADLLIPGWREEVEVTRFLPNMVANGGIMTLAGRPDVGALKLGGIAICGDWVGPEGMLADASVSSALRAAAWLGEGQERGQPILQTAGLPRNT
jgi:phytoene dehydrogenase-like protein